MPVFPSAEWAKALGEDIAKDEELVELLKDFETDFVFAYEADDKLKEPVYLYVKSSGGGLAEVAELKSVDEREAEFVVTGPYSIWKGIIKGEVDSMQAVMKGQLKLKGNMSKLLKNIKAQNALMNAMGKLETQFVDEV